MDAQRGDHANVNSTINGTGGITRGCGHCHAQPRQAFTGTTNVNGGHAQLAGGDNSCSSTPSAPGKALNVNGGGILDLNGTNQVGGRAGQLQYGGA